MPLLRNADKSKISKRRNPVSLGYYERAGYLPEAMLNYLAMMGWTMPDQSEKFTVAQMIEQLRHHARLVSVGQCSISRSSRGSMVLYMRELAAGRKWSSVCAAAYCSVTRISRKWQRSCVSVSTSSKILSATRIFSSPVSVPIDAKALVSKGPRREGAQRVVRAQWKHCKTRLDGLRTWTHATIEEVVKAFIASDTPLAAKRSASCFVRIAVTGKSATPPLFETMEVLGQRSRAAGACAKRWPR